jgi:hypothetical protein
LGQLRLIIAQFRSLAGRPAPPLIGRSTRGEIRCGGRANVAIIGLALL